MLLSVSTLIWLYVGISIALMLAVRTLRLYPLYLLKGLWVTFTIASFAWMVMMSGTATDEFANNPAGFFRAFGDYGDAFRFLFAVNTWWLPFVLLLPLWFARACQLKRLPTRIVHIALLLLIAVIVAPVVVLVGRFNWAPYSNFSANYQEAWNIARMGDYFLNSVLVSGCAVGLVSVVGSLAAYGLTRVEFFGKSALQLSLLAGMSVPGALLMVPLFVMMKDWSFAGFSFSNSRIGISIVYAALSLPFTVFLLSAFYRSLPSHLAKAAVIDGARPWHIFSEIYFPLSIPALATSAVFNFLAIWNEYHFALVFLTNPDFKTLPIGLYNLQVSQEFARNWPAMFAGIVILILPTFLVFLLLQEKIVAGLTIGAVKG